MTETLLGILSSLVAAVIGGVAVWGWRKLVLGRRRRRRLQALQRAASEGEVAICVRVGGGSNPVPDALKYLREKHPAIKRLVVYCVTSEEADHKLDEPQVSNRIVKDLYDIVRTYGEGEVSRVHIFYAGMLAYLPVFGTMFNWCTVVVYHKGKDSYTPLYEIDKEWIYKGQDEFKNFKEWEVVSVDAALAARPAAQLHGPSAAPQLAPTVPAGARGTDTPKV
ncbi:MAG: hypothetical protein M3348_07495 [Acidobacteriota bacterium]|nr:hypothetical protein [Acidobacteriota bacterium]